MMSSVQARCPKCGAVLQPRVFSVDSAPGSPTEPGTPPAFLTGIFLWCPECDYMEALH